MKIYERKVFWLIMIFIIILVIGTFYFYKNFIEINLRIPLDSKNYLTFIGILLTTFGTLFGWLYKLDLQEEKEKHLGYIRTINDRIGKKIDGNFFSDISKAQKFCEKENYYIVPYGYKYNVSSIDDEKIVHMDINPDNNKTLLKIIKEDIVNNFDYNILQDKLNDYREFIDLEYFVERLNSNNKNNFEIKDQIINENFINKESFNKKKEIIIKFLDEQNDFIIIEGYYYLYKI